MINYGVDPRNRAVLNPFISQAASSTVLHDYTKEPPSATPSDRLVVFGSKLNQPPAPVSRSNEPVSDWGDDEAMKLLDGIDKFKDDWDLVAQHVGTRTKEQCIAYFLQWPIEDKFLQPNIDISAQLNEDGTPKIEHPLPFADASNPIMATVAFLASTVNPVVASAAAKAALRK